jgi:N-acetylglucosaminyl-diphospho-decaprenol L-rhamnosyltransferase
MLPVDVVVVSYNSEAHLRALVGPLSSEAALNVIVVDSASRDGTLASVQELPITTVALEHNRGFAHACNVGWRRGESPFVLFLNPDATIDVDDIGRLVVAVEKPNVGAAAPRIVGPTGTLEYSLRRFPRLRTTYAQALFLHRFFPRASWSDELVRAEEAYELPSSPEWVSGACVMVRRSALEKIGGFDEGFFLYCEDIDLCKRLRDAGIDIRFVPEATAVHEGGASAPRASLLPVLATSRVRYAQLHQRRPVALLERLGIALGALTHAIASRGGRAARTGHLRAIRVAVSPSPKAKAPEDL